MEPYHSLFRERAIKEYIQRQEKDVLPRFTSPYITIFFYPLLLLLLLVGLFVWWGEVPLFISGSGVVLAEGHTNAPQNTKMVIVLFLPAKYASQIHPGAYAQMSVESARQRFTGRIEHVEARIMSPGEARKRYMLNDVTAQVITQSSVAAILLPAAKAYLICMQEIE